MPDMTRKNLPIGIQTLREIREDGHYYVDKTPFALRLVEQGKYYFLSRPRRFGKSLFLDTLKELFEGNQALFIGLHAQQHWDWSLRYPVLRLSFGAGVLKTVGDVQASIHEQLGALEGHYQMTAQFPDARSRFKRLIARAQELSGQRVVVLVDEYDKPILDSIEDQAHANTLRCLAGKKIGETLTGRVIRHDILLHHDGMPCGLTILIERVPHIARACIQGFRLFRMAGNECHRHTIHEHAPFVWMTCMNVWLIRSVPYGALEATSLKRATPSPALSNNVSVSADICQRATRSKTLNSAISISRRWHAICVATKLCGKDTASPSSR